MTISLQYIKLIRIPHIFITFKINILLVGRVFAIHTDKDEDKIELFKLPKKKQRRQNIFQISQ